MQSALMKQERPESHLISATTNLVSYLGKYYVHIILMFLATLGNHSSY